MRSNIPQRIIKTYESDRPVFIISIDILSVSCYYNDVEKIVIERGNSDV